MEDNWKQHGGPDSKELENEHVHVMIVKRNNSRYQVMAHEKSGVLDTIDETIETNGMDMAKRYVLNMLKIKAHERIAKLKGLVDAMDAEAKNIKT